VLLRGRCRHCQQRISLRYPLVEAAYAALVVASLALYGPGLEALHAAVFCFFALGLLVTDLETMLLPDALTLPGALLGLLAAPALAPPGQRAAALGWAALTAVAGAALLLLVRWLYRALRHRDGLGLGDVKLMALLGAWLGPVRLGVAFFLGVVAAALWGTALIARHRSRRPAHAAHAGERDLTAAAALRLPLGTFLCAGALISLFAGDRLFAWYLGLFR
jgi:leader peptidase (prepilin peptidase) / N-methyltransferase